MQNIKEYLHQGYRIARGIRIKRERINELRELAGHSSAAYNSDGGSGGTRLHSKLENCICQMDKWEREIDKDIVKLVEVEQLIRQVKNIDYRQLLELRYIDGYFWGDIALRMGKSERHILRMHGKVLQEISKCH